MLPGSRGIWISYGKILIFRKDSAQSLTILSFEITPNTISIACGYFAINFFKKDFL